MISHRKLDVIGMFGSPKYDVNPQPNTRGIGPLVGRTSRYRRSVMHVLAVILSITCHFFFVCQNIFIRVIWSDRKICHLLIYPSIFLYILINNENTSSGKCPTLVKTMLLTGQSGVTVVASLPTNLSRDVTANIPINQIHYKHVPLLKGTYDLKFYIHDRKVFWYLLLFKYKMFKDDHLILRGGGHFLKIEIRTLKMLKMLIFPILKKI